jgi:hypothetical protein
MSREDAIDAISFNQAFFQEVLALLNLREAIVR